MYMTNGKDCDLIRKNLFARRTGNYKNSNLKSYVNAINTIFFRTKYSYSEKSSTVLNYSYVLGKY